MTRLVSSIVLLCQIFLVGAVVAAPGDVVFVTQPPLPADFATINAVFGNHLASLELAPRGGDLYIRYADGTLKNLTRAAGLGQDGMQGSRSIAVRDPAVHWDGAKILFSMVVGAPTKQYEIKSYRWQLYEMTGLGRDETPVVSKVSQQPLEYNNVMGVYGSDDAILFISDRPRAGESHLYPQLDEYESTATNSGLWKLDPASGNLQLLDHAPSGDFHPIVDSFGRVVFSRWDHLQRDQQKDAGAYGTFDYSSEKGDSVPTNDQFEVFPEPRSASDPAKQSAEELHTFNQFFPWMVLQNGTELETLNHVGRHELASYGGASRNDDSNLTYLSSGGVRTAADIFLHIREDPNVAGRFIGVSCPEFGTHAAGQLVVLNGAPSINPDDMRYTYITHPDTAGTSDAPSANHTGMYRNPLILTSGVLIASHTAETRQDQNIGSSSQPKSRYTFRLKQVSKSGEYSLAETPLTPGIRESISYWQPDYLVEYVDQEMWELQPVELVARARPPLRTHAIPEIERSLFDGSGFTLEQFQSFLRERELALIVVRDVTSRDAADRQQPFNLRVTGTSKTTVGGGGAVYDLSSMQLMQADLLRGIGGSASPRAGRRVLARPMHDLPVTNPTTDGLPVGAVKIGTDGSVAAFVPARRALSWQLLGPDKAPVVRERFWVTFQPGEIRVCGGCHGANRVNQAGQDPPTNSPEALRTLLASVGELPPAGSNDPQVSLAVVRARKVVSSLKRGDAFQVRVTPTDSASGGRSITLTASEGRCRVSRLVSLPASGIATVSGVLPYRKLKGVLTLDASVNDTSVRTLSVPVTRRKKAPARISRCNQLLSNRVGNMER